jgi:hypothetical protein
VEDDLPGVHQRNLGARGADVLDQVGRDHHGGPLTEVAQQGAERNPLLGVQPGGRLVEQQ